MSQLNNISVSTYFQSDSIMLFLNCVGYLDVPSIYAFTYFDIFLVPQYMYEGHSVFFVPEGFLLIDV